MYTLLQYYYSMGAHQVNRKHSFTDTNNYSETSYVIITKSDIKTEKNSFYTQ
jgi:hypothetical protein